MSEEYLTTKQAAERLGISFQQVRYAWRTGHFPNGRRVKSKVCGSLILIPASDVDQFRAVVEGGLSERYKAARARHQGQPRCTRCGLLSEGIDENHHCQLCAEELAGNRSHWYPISPLAAATFNLDPLGAPQWRFTTR